MTDHEICGKPATALRTIDRLWYSARCAEHQAPEDMDWTPTEWDTHASSICRYRG